MSDTNFRFFEPLNSVELREMLVLLIDLGDLDFLQIDRHELIGVVDEVVTCVNEPHLMTGSIKVLGKVMLKALESRLSR